MASFSDTLSVSLSLVSRSAGGQPTLTQIESAAAPAVPPPQADAEAVDGEPAAKRAKVDGEGGEGEASGEAIAEAATSIPAGAPGAPPPDEDSAANLEASLSAPPTATGFCRCCKRSPRTTI